MPQLSTFHGAEPPYLDPLAFSPEAAMKKAPVWMIVRAGKAIELGSAKSGSTLTTAMVLASKGCKVDPEDGLLDLSPGSWAAWTASIKVRCVFLMRSL